MRAFAPAALLAAAPISLAAALLAAALITLAAAPAAAGATPGAGAGGANAGAGGAGATGATRARAAGASGAGTTGATRASSGGVPSSLAASGGARFDPAARRRRARQTARRRRASRAARPELASFALAGRRIFRHGRPGSLTFRIDARARLRDVRVYLTPLGARTPLATLRLGPRPRGVVQRLALGAQEIAALPDGAYTVRIGAKDSRGRRLRRRPGIVSPLELSIGSHRFPLAGPFSFGGRDARFGAGRRGHRHQGQDLTAAEGTPVVAPRGGVVKAVEYQAGGAGHYVVLDGAGEDRDYVFMHLKTGSIPVREGQRVRTGRRLGEVGSTGSSSGPHLHFEIWTGGGWYTGGSPIDPLPLLRAWSR